MFPSRITTDITIYNKIESTEKWVFTQLKGVFFDEAKAQNVKVSGITSADDLNLFIPFDVETIGETKEYREPKMFQENPQGAWTLQEGDCVVKELIEMEIVSPKDLKNNYDNVYTINIIDAKLFGSKRMWHWEVGAN